MTECRTSSALIRRAVACAIAASLLSQQVAVAANELPLGGSHQNDARTASPIKHVIVIMGENRTFDHLFATYQPRRGEHVDNLLSKGIVNIDGSPGPNYALAAQYSAVDTGSYSIAPGQKVAYDQVSNKLQAPGTSYAFQACYSNISYGVHCAAKHSVRRQDPAELSTLRDNSCHSAACEDNSHPPPSAGCVLGHVQGSFPGGPVFVFL
jgi:Phosphoesterase family